MTHTTNKTNRTYHIQTFGCQMNAADSEWLARSIQALGFSPAPFEEANFYILNTCSVRDKPEQKVYSELGRIARHSKIMKRKNITVCVGGCVAQQVGPALTRRFPQVRLLFGTDGIANAPKAMERLAEEPGLRLTLLDFAQNYLERDDPRLYPASCATNGAIAPTAFVNIMQGCDNYCTYCIVPFVRGRQKSRAPDAVLRECQSLVQAGAREITLLGQNVNSYGQDLGPGSMSFPELLHGVAAIKGLERLRFVTSHPKDIAPKVIAAFGELENLCPRLHLPLQSGSDRILKAMNRRYDSKRYLDIVQALRRARPDLVLTTDIIVGFPGESEADFQATLDIMEHIGFVSAFSFVYSDRPGAKACLLPGKIERDLALDRLSRLQERQNKASEEVLVSCKGSRNIILVEGKSRRGAAMYWQGRTPQGFIVNVALGAPPDQARGWLGALVPVRIDAAAKHSLRGSPTGEPW
ncbi:tRNA (N6-isopentenyl adenosine(37)-C2)-methylthiotransferase MiaB [Desulfovibrio sp. OttesenSCG-928-F20]|nr:tRNA (N6-isopentenyl adenosine(37)-C2)-methylthiotransferase MiaB [Desulfovibrio sp. OttesenSCG-928-F20]